MEQMDQKLKTFWERPEGRVGGVVGALLFAGALVGLYKILPWLITLAANLLHLAILLVALGVLLYVVLDPRTRALAFQVYRMVMRWITGLFIQLDPIAVLKTYVETLKDNLRQMDTQIGKLRGTMTSLRRTIEENKRSAEQNMQMASKAKETGKQAIMVLQARKAGRLQESNLKLTELYTKMELIYRVLTKMYENCNILLEDTADQIKVKEAEWKAIQASHKAMKSAMSVISGDKDQRAIYEQALEYMADDLGNKIGEMERFMQLSEGFMDGVDLQNGIYEEKGIKMLEEWEKQADSLILGDQKPMLIQQANDDKQVLDLALVPATPQPVAVRGNQFERLFEKP